MTFKPVSVHPDELKMIRSMLDQKKNFAVITASLDKHFPLPNGQMRKSFHIRYIAQKYLGYEAKQKFTNKKHKAMSPISFKSSPDQEPREATPSVDPQLAAKVFAAQMILGEKTIPVLTKARMAADLLASFRTA